MKRFAAVANAGASHQMAMCAIGRELQRRGHEFLLLGTKFQLKQLRLSDIPFEVIGATRNDPVEGYVHRAKETGSLPISATLEYMKGMAELLCTELPPIFRSHRIDVVLADQEEPGVATAADLAQLPYASICNSLPLNAAPDVPPGFLPWQYSPSRLATVRNWFGYAIRNQAISGVNRVLNTHRCPAKLLPYRRPDDSFSRCAQITQLVLEFDFPYKAPPRGLHYVGPFQRQQLFPVEFPYERLTQAPIIYVSLGTSFGNSLTNLRAIAAGCTALSVQLVISLGGAKVLPEHNRLAGRPIVVSYAPQREILSRSVLVISHGGLNTTMEALSFGVPMLALPVAGDQFGVGSRIVWHGVGHMLKPGRRTPDHIRAAILSVFNAPQRSAAAQRMARVINNAGGITRAADIVESLAL
jgi:zeaxanthin glucosyltransferase